MKTILVLCGGRSTEHEISLRSAKNIINELDRTQYRVVVFYVDKQGRFVPLGEVKEVAEPDDLRRETSLSRVASVQEFCQIVDQLAAESAQGMKDLVVIPAIHGQTGEDGEIQGFLQTLGLNYVGTRLTASALCMDKGYANAVMEAFGIPEADYMIYQKSEWGLAGRTADELAGRIEAAFGFPCFVKPANNGSSVGVHRSTRESLEEDLRDAFRYDSHIVIEEEIVGHEIEVSVIGNEFPEASQPGSYTSTHEVLDYEAKYNDHTTRENVPHPMAPEKAEEAQKLAILAYRALGCEGLARVDMFLTEFGDLFVNEINTFPGMTPSSLAPKLWTALTDMTFSDYLNRIIAYALASGETRESVETSWEEA